MSLEAPAAAAASTGGLRPILLEVAGRSGVGESAPEPSVAAASPSGLVFGAGFCPFAVRPERHFEDTRIGASGSGLVTRCSGVPTLELHCAVDRS
jgi:hypothetical protein